MKGRVQVRIVCTDETAAGWVRDQLVTKWVENPRYSDVVEPDGPPTVMFDDVEPAWVVVANGRFDTRANAVAIRDWLAEQYDSKAAVRNRVVRIEGSVHDCRHDEASPTDCTTEQYVSGVLRP